MFLVLNDSVSMHSFLIRENVRVSLSGRRLQIWLSVQR